MVSWCGPVHPIKLPRHVQIVSSYGQDDHPLCVCVRSCDIVIYYVYIHKRTYIYIYACYPPKQNCVFFCSLYAAALRCINPLFGCINCWRNTVWTLLLEKHCVDSTHIYIYSYIYIQYIYICILCICICIC